MRALLLDIANIKDFIEAYPEQKIEGNHDIRKLNVEKITGTDADYEKNKLNENKMVEITVSMLNQVQFDREGRKMFQDLVVHVLKRRTQHK
jgi:hypothetical protein